MPRTPRISISSGWIKIWARRWPTHDQGNTVKFLGKQYGMSPRDAYSLCSTIIDFSVAEAVDVNLAMYGTVPKAYFSPGEIPLLENRAA